MSSLDNEPIDAQVVPPRIDIDDYYVVREWCDRLGVSKHRLRDAVSAVGADPNAVQQYLLRSAPPALMRFGGAPAGLPAR